MKNFIWIRHFSLNETRSKFGVFPTIQKKCPADVPAGHFFLVGCLRFWVKSGQIPEKVGKKTWFVEKVEKSFNS